MKSVTTIWMMALALGAAAPASRAQAPAAKEATAAFNRWVTEPTPIAFGAEQKPRIDSLRLAFVKEQSSLSNETKSGGERMQVVIKMRSLAKKYQAAIRDVLRPDQRAQFDRNLEAQKGTLSPPPEHP